MVNDILDLQQEAEDVDLLYGDGEGPSKRPRHSSEVEGFGGTLLGGFTTDSSGTSAPPEGPEIGPPESSSPFIDEPKACPNCTLTVPVPTPSQCEVCSHVFRTD